MSQSPSLGRVLKYHSNFYYVAWQGDVYECFLKGTLKKEGVDVLVGDFVQLDSLEPDAKRARVVQVVPRQHLLSRPKVANVSQIIIIQPIAEPTFSASQLDRFLTHVAVAKLPALICISKCDLVPSADTLEALKTLYQDQLGYTVLFTSIREPQTLTVLTEQLAHQVSVLAGVSGAGKSSLINTLNPQLQLRVGEVSHKLRAGQHTTRHVELLEISSDTYLADTPGFSHLNFSDVEPEAIEAAFPDFAPYRAQCDYPNCLHVDEPHCAVKNHLGQIASSRYESYQTILGESLSAKNQRSARSQKEAFGSKTLHQKGKDALTILRLKEKARESSRRKQKQELSLGLEESLAEDPLDLL